MRSWSLPLRLMGLLALAQCSSGDAPSATVCRRACTHLQQCGVSRIKITSDKSYGYEADCAQQACDSITDCVSRCVEVADCSALSTVALGGPLHSCMAACNSWFRVGDGGP